MEKINMIKMARPINALECPNCGKLFFAAPRCPDCGQRVVEPGRWHRDMKERVALVRAMETVCRNLNDECILVSWLTCGVADEDITSITTDEEIRDEYCEDDETFIDLMDTFLRCMLRANKSGGLFCGDVTSTIGEEEE